MMMSKIYFTVVFTLAFMMAFIIQFGESQDKVIPEITVPTSRDFVIDHCQNVCEYYSEGAMITRDCYPICATPMEKCIERLFMDCGLQCSTLLASCPGESQATEAFKACTYGIEEQITKQQFMEVRECYQKWLSTYLMPSADTTSNSTTTVSTSE